MQSDMHNLIPSFDWTTGTKKNPIESISFGE
jgi:hypothetical protein